MIRCVAIDDEPLALTVIESHCSNIDNLELVKIFTNPLDGVMYLNSNEIDLLFIDIQMPKLNGMDALKTLPNPPAVIFTTAYSEYAAESYELNAIDYLLKPISLPRFMTAIQKVQTVLTQQLVTEIATPEKQAQPSDYFFVKSENKSIKVAYEDILYIEGQRDYVQLHLKESKIMSLMTMKKLEQSLPDNLFVRTHRSFIVSLNAVENYAGKTITINGDELPVGDSYFPKVKKVIESMRI